MKNTKRRTTWWDLLTPSLRKHLREDAGVRSAEGMRGTVIFQNSEGIVCHECRHAAHILRELRPDLEIQRPAPLCR